MAFEPRYEAFQPRTIWSLSNAFTSAFKELDPIPQFRLRQSWGNFFKPDSRSRSNTGSGTGRLPLSRKTETIDHVWIMFADVHLLDSFCCSAMNLGDADFTRAISRGRGTLLYIKLRDDPSAVNGAALLVLPEP